MAWLAIDTTGTGCHVGLLVEGQTYALHDMQPQSHAKTLLPMIDQLLQQVGMTRFDLTGIVYTKGPGSFTGVRVGVSVVQGLSFSLSLPTLGVSALQLLAWQGYQSTGEPAVAAVIDARMSQVYFGAYAFSPCSILVDDCVMYPKDIIPYLSEVSIVVGDVQLLNVQEISMPLQAEVMNIEALLRMAEYLLAEKKANWTNDLALPVYLRQDVVSLPKLST